MKCSKCLGAGWRPPDKKVILSLSVPFVKCECDNGHINEKAIDKLKEKIEALNDKVR